MAKQQRPDASTTYGDVIADLIIAKRTGTQPFFDVSDLRFPSSKGKRFTDAELASEVLMHERDHWRDMATGGIRQWRYDRLLKIRDIASRPNYDED